MYVGSVDELMGPCPLEEQWVVAGGVTEYDAWQWLGVVVDWVWAEWV